MQWINAMEQIYSQAKLTIVAATGSGAHCGLSGWSDKSERNQHCIELDVGLRLGVLPSCQRELLDCEHVRRAWTYQETCLSPRCLVFLNGFVYFNCNEAVYTENLHSEVPGIEPEASANSLGKTQFAEAALQRYAQHCFAYSSRKLTHESDGLNAFTGIAKSMSQDFRCAYMLYGLPRSCFDWAVLWTGRGSLRRRSIAMSWAWVGWTGEILMAQSTSNEYDQDWLLKATWIAWYVVTQDDCAPVWDSRKPGYQVSPVALEKQRDRDESSDDVDKRDAGDVDGHCPTYGPSTSNNAFGRRVHSESMRLIPPRPKDMSASYQCSMSENDGFLCFASPTITISSRATFHPSTTVDSPMIALLDREARTCGFMSVTNSDLWPTSGDRKVKLLLVSVTSYGNLSAFHAAGLTSQVYQAYGVEDHLEEYLQSLPDEVDNFDFLNVMYVQETETKAELAKADSDSGKRAVVDAVAHERSGLGFIYREALLSVGDIEWNDVLLA